MKPLPVAEERAIRAADASFAEIVQRVRARGRLEPEDVQETSRIWGVTDFDAERMLHVCSGV